MFFFPRRCSNQILGQQDKCQASLTKSGVKGGRSIRVPIKPFVVQSLDEFLSRLLSRADMIGVLRKGTVTHKTNINGVKASVVDGTVLPNIKGSDGLPFMVELDDELRLAFCLSIDWFNPYHNKMAGKKASLGVITLACLNLPPEARYKQENLFLAAVLPGPKETSVLEMNFFLTPLVDMFIHAWQNGTRFEAEGRYFLVKSIVACLVADLPAARKVGGMAHFSASKFCGFCKQAKTNINNIEWWTWQKRTNEEVRKVATQWRDASSMSERKHIFKEQGIRWSELLRLPYWDPTAQIVVDGMHNLFLGVVQHHVRDILGFDDEKQAKARAAQKQKPRCAQTDNPSLSIPIKTQQRVETLTLMKVPQLKELCRGANLKGYSRPGVKKADLINMLMVSSSIAIVAKHSYIAMTE
jgi:hypothetical protein